MPGTVARASPPAVDLVSYFLRPALEAIPGWESGDRLQIGNVGTQNPVSATKLMNLGMI